MYLKRVLNLQGYADMDHFKSWQAKIIGRRERVAAEDMIDAQNGARPPAAAADEGTYLRNVKRIAPFRAPPKEL